MRPRILLVRSASLNEDIRTPKIIKALNEKGYFTTLINWERESLNFNDQLEKEMNCRKLTLKIKSPYGFRVLPFYIIWWFHVAMCALRTKWDLAYAINFDCAVPTIVVSILKRKPVIYEILDVQEDQVQFPWWIRKLLLGIDKFFLRFSNAVVLVDEMQLLELEGIPNRNIFVIYDSPSQTDFSKELKYGDIKEVNEFRIFYTGVLMRNRLLNIEKVVNAIKDINGVKLIIAGYGDMVPEIKRWVSLMPNKIQYIGKIKYEKVIKIGMKMNLFFILRDPTRKLNRYTCGSNLFNAMACGKPIIVNKGTSTAKKVAEAKCGLIVDANNVEEIRKAILKLKNNIELCKTLGTNGRKAYEQRYCWELMAKRLLTLLHKLRCRCERAHRD